MKRYHSQYEKGFTPTPILSLKNDRARLVSGFTVIEMITVISIFGILTGVLFFNYTKFQKNTDFSIFAQEVGLLIKKQQQDAMAGKFPDIDPQDKEYPDADWKPAYGVYLKLGAGADIIEFYDNSVDHEYTINGGGGGCDTDPTDECINIVSLTNDRTIFGIYEGGYPGGTQLDDLSIVFQRPYPDAHMKTDYQTFFVGNTQAVDVTDKVDILLKDDNTDGFNILSINPVGAISVRRGQ